MVRSQGNDSGRENTCELVAIPFANTRPYSIQPLRSAITDTCTTPRFPKGWIPPMSCSQRSETGMATARFPLTAYGSAAPLETPTAMSRCGFGSDRNSISRLQLLHPINAQQTPLYWYYMPEERRFVLYSRISGDGVAVLGRINLE